MQAAVLDDNYDRDWKDDAVATIIGLSHTLETFSADDLAREMRRPNRSGQVGAAFRSAQAQGFIESIDSQKSSTKSRNHGRNLRWRRKTNEGFVL